MKQIFLILLIVSFTVGSQESASSNNMDGDLNTNTQNTQSTVNSHNTNDTKTTNNYGAGSGAASPVMSAVSPSLMSTGADTCLMSTGGGLQLVSVGMSAGNYTQDEECNRRRDAKVLNDLGMKVPAISIMCQNINVWKAMFSAGSPCPIIVKGNMVFGKNAILIMKNKPEVYIPDYEEKDFWGNYVNKDYYNQILGIGGKNEENENLNDDISISQRFRTSISSN